MLVSGSPIQPIQPVSLSQGAVSADQPILALDPARHPAMIDRSDFLFQHRLSEQGLFDTDRLLRLADVTSRERPCDVYYDAGKIGADARWTEMAPCGFSVTDALRRLETADAWIILRKVHLDPDYAPILERCMKDILDVAGPAVARRARSREVILFITSPRRVAAYHIDHECGFLLQIRGQKDVSVFDKNDRDVLTEQELELFWTRDNNAAVYRPELQGRATPYCLTPGQGVHIPINAPHWVQNGAEVSVSANINFIESENERGNVYRANYHLRKFGLHPRPPYQSAPVDAIKRPLGALSMGARAAVRRARKVLRRDGDAAAAH